MFTGIVKELGVVQGLSRLGGVYRLDVMSKLIYKDANIGDSVSINGVCLTLVGKKEKRLSFDIMEETVRRTDLKDLKIGDQVNAEDSLRVGSPLGGHFVLGHIDCASKIKKIDRSGKEYVMEIGMPGEFSFLVVEKGSVAIDGISLTVGEITANAFKVYLIPHTLKITNLGGKKAGDAVNIEFDMIGKYIARLAGQTRIRAAITEDFLKKKGF